MAGGGKAAEEDGGCLGLMAYLENFCFSQGERGGRKEEIGNELRETKNRETHFL